MYLPQNRLYLIPFYDFYVLRDHIKNRPEFDQMRKQNRVTEYLKIRRQFNKSIKRQTE